MTTSVNKYRIPCVTEATNVYSWGTTKPTLCPNNSAHTINSDLIAIVDNIKENKLKIDENQQDTNGNFKYFTLTIESTGPTGGEETTFKKFTRPFPISMVNGTLHIKEHQLHDSLYIYAAPLPVGPITQDCATGATGIYINTLGFEKANVGFFVRLTDGVNTSNYSTIIQKIDSDTGLCVLETPIDNGFLSSNTTAELKILFTEVDKLGYAGKLTIGQAIIGGTYVPKNTPIWFEYINRSGQYTMSAFHMEFFY
jgi:hypothetical protein